MYFPEGSKFFFSSTFAAGKNVTAITNANPARATATAHGYNTGDEVLFTSGWEDATDNVFRVTAVDAATLDIAGLNSSNTDFFPAGTGTGSLKLVSAWQEIPGILSVSTNGGDPRFTTVSPLAKRNDIQVPTGFNAMSMTLDMIHDPANAVYQQMLDLGRALKPVALKVQAAGGMRGYGYGYINAGEMPQLARNEVNKVQAAITFKGRFIAYAAP